MGCCTDKEGEACHGPPCLREGVDPEQPPHHARPPSHVPNPRHGGGQGGAFNAPAEPVHEGIVGGDSHDDKSQIDGQGQLVARGELKDGSCSAS